ncbi:response regulator transcription factor [Bradyrhizobium sp. KB893862 SZCCT0404]|uniref:LuxR C-terminal-related transcriptional regulator n=1 Tax=Bradyrhizobium sp. KB893862 SZCCT0404 TaxID=2807672 RepID=UPI001BA5EA61|nr:response regulator transcription factor [Bradyrhizobium sp. KB893862 SZCCT0404]MBR1172810.1 response regulator transcription factor [Bradyrhizobium sp. KB893862 SZCCT0404]
MRRYQSYEVALIGKSVLIREGIARILHEANFRMPISVSSPEDLPSSLQAQQLMFLIVHTGDDFALAVSEIGYVKDRYPNAPVAIVSDNYRPVELASAFRAGASGYFVNVNSCDAFIKSVELVTMGETVFPPAFLSFALDGNREHETMERTHHEHAPLVPQENVTSPQLSPRENAILACLIEGDSNKCIARKIDIAEATVKVHVKAILRKIRVQNRTQAAIWGMNHGSQARAANDHAPAAGEAGAPIVRRHGAIPEPEHLDETAHLVRQSSHVAVPPVDGLLRKGTAQRTGAAVRLYK